MSEKVKGDRLGKGGRLPCDRKRVSRRGQRNVSVCSLAGLSVGLLEEARGEICRCVKTTCAEGRGDW